MFSVEAQQELGVDACTAYKYTKEVVSAPALRATFPEGGKSNAMVDSVMSALKTSELVELQARVIIIKSYVQFLLLESATMPQFHFLIEGQLAKLQAQISELEVLTARLCGESPTLPPTPKNAHASLSLDG